MNKLRGISGIVSIRFEVRGGFRRLASMRSPSGLRRFQSALRFAVVSDRQGGLFTDSVAASKTPSQGALEEGCE